MPRLAIFSVVVLSAALLSACAPTMDEQLTRSIGALSEVQSSDRAVESDVLAHAQGIAIVQETQWAVAVGGSDGRGVLMRRVTGGKWSAPCAITTSALSLGLSIGGEARSVVFVFDKDETLDRLVSDGNFFLANAQGTIGGSHGRTDEPAQAGGDVHAYVVASGLFVSAALGNMTFRVDDDINHAAYGPEITVWDILDGHTPPPAGWRALTARLDRISGVKTDTADAAQRVSTTPPTAPNASVVETHVETADHDEPAATPRKPRVER